MAKGNEKQELHRINERIKAREVKLIDEKGTQLGVVSTQEALKIASERGLDLMEVGQGEVPICKIIDYGKFKYQKKKKEQEAKKKQTVITLKEVQLSPKIEKHDLEFKLKHIERFLRDGDKAKIVMIFKGREIVYVDHGRAILDKVIEATKEYGQVEQPPKLEGKRLFTILCPAKQTTTKPKKEKEAKPASEPEAPASSEAAPSAT